MNNLYIPLLLLNLTKNETQVLLLLFLIYESENKKEIYDIKEIAKFTSLSTEGMIDTLNKLVIKNIIGKIVMEGIVTPKVIVNFDIAFLNILYDKTNPLESAIQKVKFSMKADDTTYVLNPIIKSWRYQNKEIVVKELKKLDKAIPDNQFIKYLLEGYNYGAKGGKRMKSISKINNWTVKDSMITFREEFHKAYGSTYNPSNRDYKHLKDILLQLSAGNLDKSRLKEFFQHSFEKAISRDYVIQIAGLKYYANEFLAKAGNNLRRY